MYVSGSSGEGAVSPIADTRSSEFEGSPETGDTETAEKQPVGSLDQVCDTDISFIAEIPYCTEAELYLLKNNPDAAVRKVCKYSYKKRHTALSDIIVGQTCSFSVGERYSVLEFVLMMKNTSSEVEQYYRETIFTPPQEQWERLEPFLEEGDEIWTATSTSCGMFWGFFIARDKQPLCFVFTEHMM